LVGMGGHRGGMVKKSSNDPSKIQLSFEGEYQRNHKKIGGSDLGSTKKKKKDNREIYNEELTYHLHMEEKEGGVGKRPDNREDNTSTEKRKSGDLSS